MQLWSQFERCATADVPDHLPAEEEMKWVHQNLLEQVEHTPSMSIFTNFYIPLLAHVSGLSLLLLVQSFFSFLACLLVLSKQCELLEMLLLFYKDYEFSADKLVEKMKLCLVWLTAYTYHVLN